MKYLLLFFILVGCNNNEKIIEEAKKIIKDRTKCEKIATSLNALGDFTEFRPSGEYVCYLYLKENLDAPISYLDREDLNAIARYLEIKEIVKQ